MKHAALFAVGLAATVASMFAPDPRPGATAALLLASVIITLSSIGSDRLKK